MYVVDLSFWSLVSCMSIMCGVVGKVCVSSCIPGRLELMHPVFHVIIFKVVIAWWLYVFVIMAGVGLGFVSCVGGWYPLIGWVHLVSSSRIFRGM